MVNQQKKLELKMVARTTMNMVTENKLLWFQ